MINIVLYFWSIFYFFAQYDCIAQCFFLAWKRKWAWKPIFDLFLHFFTGKVSVSRPLFLAFFTFFTPNWSFFTGKNGVFWFFFTGTKKKKSRAYFRGFLRLFCDFHGYFCWFFSRPLIFFSRVPVGEYFHGQKLIFTRTFVVNFRFFHGHFLFFTCKNPKISKIFTGVFFFSRQKKNTGLLLW